MTPGTSGNTCTPAHLASGDCTSLYNPSPKDAWTGSIARSTATTDTDTETLAAYVFDTLKFNEQWSLNMGLRYDDYETEQKAVSTAGVVTRPENKSHFWNYQLGRSSIRCPTAASTRPGRPPATRPARPVERVPMRSASTTRFSIPSATVTTRSAPSGTSSMSVSA